MNVGVVVHPNAKQPRIEKSGKANRAVIEALAEYFHTKRGNVSLLRGLKSKQKVFEINSENIR